MFAQSMTEDEINKNGSSSDIRFFHTTYGATFGYNERARKYHRSYGLVTPPTNEAFQSYRLGDLATAPLFRRNHLGFRVDYADSQYTWSESANNLSKNMKTYGETQQPLQASSSERAAEAARLQRQHQLALQQQAQFEAQYEARRQAHRDSQLPAAFSPAGRPILTSSLSPNRMTGRSFSSTGRNPLIVPGDHNNPHLYPTAALKSNHHNPQYDAPR